MDFTISTDLVYLETDLALPNHLDYSVLPRNPLAMEPCNSTHSINTDDKLFIYLNVKIDNLIWLKPYPHDIYIRTLNTPKKVRSYIFPRIGHPSFSSKIVLELPLNMDITDDLLPITIQGIGGDGKIRNCTLFLSLYS